LGNVDFLEFSILILAKSSLKNLNLIESQGNSRLLQMFQSPLK